MTALETWKRLGLGYASHRHAQTDNSHAELKVPEQFLQFGACTDLLGKDVLTMQQPLDAIYKSNVHVNVRS